MNLTFFTIAWAVIAVLTALLMVYKKMVTSHEDDTVHLMDEEVQMVREQATVANKVALIDRWRKILMIVTIVAGVALGGLYMYEAWVEGSKITY